LVLSRGSKISIIDSGIMKTAISIDDDLLREADESAKAMGVSRSRMISLALGEFLKRRREEEMLRRLNEAYGDGLDAEEARLVRSFKKKIGRTLRDKW
jgi:antitoxin MazE6